jgi:hypothetical protein
MYKEDSTLLKRWDRGGLEPPAAYARWIPINRELTCWLTSSKKEP